MGLLEGPRGRRFLMSEVPMYMYLYLALHARACDKTPDPKELFIDNLLVRIHFCYQRRLSVVPCPHIGVRMFVPDGCRERPVIL